MAPNGAHIKAHAKRLDRCGARASGVLRDVGDENPVPGATPMSRRNKTGPENRLHPCVKKNMPGAEGMIY
jgi:hypothetical protein